MNVKLVSMTVVMFQNAWRKWNIILIILLWKKELHRTLIKRGFLLKIVYFLTWIFLRYLLKNKDLQTLRYFPLQLPKNLLNKNRYSLWDSQCIYKIILPFYDDPRNSYKYIACSWESESRYFSFQNKWTF